MAFAEGSPDELFLSDGEYQALGEQFCVHYIEEGRADEEAVALVCEHLQDPKWKMDITHKVKSTEEVTNAAVAALQDHDADRIDEVIGMIAEYADAPRDFYGHLLAMYPELDLSGVEAAVDGVDARAQLIESCKADGSQLDSFLRRFFARFVPWDGADREDKAKELCTQYFFKGTWDELHSLLKEHYPRALELNELQVIKMNGSVPDNAGTHTPASFVNTESASKSAQQEARSVAPPPSEPVPAVPAAPMEPKKRIPVLRLTRLQWLQHNAFIAKYFLMHKNENVLKRFAREMVISIGFRVYFALFYLLPGAWFLLVYSVHFFYALTWRLFLPEDTGYIQTLGLFCIFVAAAFAAASLWTHLVKTLLQWIYLDDAAFFGDVDYAVRWKDKDMRPRHRDANVPEGVGYDPEDAHGPARPLLNPVPQVHRATLPPHQRITFFGLPTSDSWSREYYCLVMGVATVLSPFLYCIIATAVKKESAYQTLSHFVEWCVVGGVAVHILLWIFAWGFTIRAKYRAYYEWSTFHNGPFESDDALLPELALDLPTAARNTVFVVVLIIPVGIIFLITSRVDPKYPVEWIFTWIAGVAYLLIMREMATDVRRFPLFIIFSAAAFCILGVVATALLNVGALAVFLVVTFMSQCLLVPHRYRPALKVNKQEFLDQASEGLTQALCEQQKRSGAGNASASVGAGGMSPNAPTEPMDNSAPPAAAAATNGELHGATVHIVTDAILRRQLEKSAPRGVDRSLLPCERVLRALCMPILSCVCPSSAFEGKNFDPSAPRELRGKGAAMPAGFWRLPSAFYGDAPDGASRHPRRKVMLQAAPRAMLSFAAAFFVSVALVLALAGYLRQAGTVQAPAAPPVPVDTASNFTSPVCSLLWSGLSVVDLAVLAETGYLRSTVDFERNYAGALQEAGWGLYGSSQHPFNASKQGPVPLRHGSLEKWGENSSTEVDWLHYATLPEDFAAANSTAEKKTANASGLTNWTNVHHVVVLRSNLEGRNLKRDLDVWGDSVAYQVVSALVPVLRVLPVVAVADWVEGLATFKRPLDGGAHPTRYLSNLHAYILNVTDTHPGPVTLVGHATNGGLAAILGAKLGLPVVAFSPPGTAYLAAKMGLKAEPNPRQLSVVPAEDQMCAIDEQGVMLPTPASHAVQASPSMLPADYLSPHAGPALADMTRENDMLRRKVKFLQHVGGVFRQKIGALFSEAAQRGDPGMKKLNAVYRSLVEEMPSFEEVSPQRHHAGYVQGAPETSEGKYWHEKFMTATHKMKSLLGTQTDTENQMAEDLRMLQEQLNMAKKQNAELRKCLDAMDVGSPRVPVPAESPRLSAMDELRGLSPGLLETRALAESDAATQMVIASMKDDNQNLTTQLNDALERLRTSDTVQQDCTLLQKQNNLLRNRLHKVKDTNAQLKLESSSTVIEMQNNISTLLTSLNEANEVIAGKDTQIALLDETKENLIKDMQAMHHVVTTYKNKVTEYEAQAMAKTKDEQRAMDQFEKEKFQLHQEVKDGEEKIGGLSGKLDELSNQVQQQLLTLRDNSYHIELLSMEKLNLNERIEQMDMLLQERSQFGTVLGEVETRLRDAVCDLHGVQSTQHVADRMRELSDSVTALEGLEGQLKIKDDTLAAREDEILKLKDAMHILEDSVNQISSMFLQMPKTVEEMEKIIIERDTYRASIEEQRPEWLDGLHEMVSIKLIEKNVMKKPLPKESREKKCISEELLKLQPIPSPNEAQEDAIMGLAAKTLQALGHSGGEIDSDEELLKDPPRSASTLGAIYESIYGKADGTAATTIPGAAAPSLTELARASVTPQHLPAPRPPLSPALGAGMPEPLPPPQPAPPAPPVAPSLDLQPNDIVHAFRAFESNGRMDADHFKTCVLALGLAYSTAADGIVAPHKSLDLETFQRAILLCEAH